MPVTYVIKFQVVPERRNEFPELLQGVLDAMREESTLHEAILHRDPESEHRFTLYETWKSHEDAASSTPSCYARGTENVLNTYNYLDLVPKGRDEHGLPFTMSWIRHHDRYADGYLADANRPYWPADAAPAR